MVGYMLKFQKGQTKNIQRINGKWVDPTPKSTIKQNILKGDVLIRESAKKGYPRANLQSFNLKFLMKTKST